MLASVAVCAGIRASVLWAPYNIPSCAFSLFLQSRVSLRVKPGRGERNSRELLGLRDRALLGARRPALGDGGELRRGAARGGEPGSSEHRVRVQRRVQGVLLCSVPACAVCVPGVTPGRSRRLHHAARAHSPFYPARHPHHVVHAQAGAQGRECARLRRREWTPMICRPKMRPARSLRLPPRAQVRVTSSGSRPHADALLRHRPAALHQGAEVVQARPCCACLSHPRPSQHRPRDHLHLAFGMIGILTHIPAGQGCARRSGPLVVRAPEACRASSSY